MTENRIRKLLMVLMIAVMSIGITACSDKKAEVGSIQQSIPEIDNGLPVVYLNIDEARGTIEAMNTSPDHSVFCYGTISIEVPEGFRHCDFPETELKSLEDISMSIRGRGNSSWEQSTKKPYKIKLDSSEDVLGLGKNKHWVLVANDFDDTLMKDRITAWIGDQMGFAFTPRGVPVDVIMTGQDFGACYLGSYYLSENVRVDTNRLEIAELKKGDTDPEVITGGYLLQNALQVRVGSPDRFYTNRGVDWATHTPSFDAEADALTASPDEGEEVFAGRELGDGYQNSAQQQYIQQYIRHVEDVLFDSTTAYRDLIDVESSAKYWLVNEISKNNDAYATGSTYIYKDRDSADGVSKLYWGPLWDFDFAWTRNIGYSGFEAGHKWIKPMFYDRSEGGFVEALHKYWPIMKKALEEIIVPGGLMDQYYQETLASARKNHDVLRPDSEFTFTQEVEKLREWIRNRIIWVDENFSMLDHMVNRVTFMVNGEVYAYDFLEESDFLSGNEPYPEIPGYTFMGWLDEEGNVIDTDLRISKDITVTARYVADDEISHGTAIAWSRASDITRNSAFFKSYQIPYVVLPQDAQDNRVIWTSSDENIATVDENGLVRYTGTGEVVLTGKLKYGEPCSFRLTIVEMDSQLSSVEAVRPERDILTMTAGQQLPLVVVTEPENAKIYGYEYISADPQVAQVGEYGVVTALEPGVTQVTVRVACRNSEEEEYTLETQSTVIVRNEEETDYVLSEDSVTRWNRGSSRVVSLKLTPQDFLNHLVCLQIDGTTLKKDADYTADPDTVTLLIRPETLSRLEEGDHQLTVFFDDGTLATSLQVMPERDVTASRTIMIICLLAAGGAITALLLKRKKQPQNGSNHNAGNVV
ncbi:MAG: CotH kinase family protein [Erysipelotrichaceae bacterium]|nr:CotH kinase family protein [Erysipelotrichaceae bacterium]